MRFKKLSYDQNEKGISRSLIFIRFSDDQTDRK